MVDVKGQIWKFVTLDCRKMHLRVPEQLKMSLKDSSTRHTFLIYLMM